MERLKQYSAALIAAALALVFLIVGVLSLTVLKPAQETVSSTVSTNTIIMTRDGVLPLLNDEVTVRATSASGAEVAIGVGTPGDVLGWIGEDPYTEVVGITSTRSELKVEEHGSPADAESGAQSGAADAQSGADGAQSAQSAPQAGLVDDLASSDMWLDAASGTGTATLTLSEVPAKRSLIAASAAGAGDLQLTLTWATEKVNTLAIVSFLGALVAALIAGVAWLSRRQLLRHREERAARLAERAGADLTDTQTIDSRRIAELVDADRAEEARSEARDRDEEPTESATVESADERGEEPEGAGGAAEALPDEAAEGVGSAEAEIPSEEDEARPVESSHEETPTMTGRHGAPDRPLDEDPPEKVPTDTGIIDLSAIRPGAALPSRRALREAREKGEATIVVDGREFDTGLIPVISGPEGDHRTPAGTAEAASPDAQSAGETEEAEKGSWTSLMSGWLRPNRQGKDRS